MNAADVFTKLPLELKPDPSRTVIRPFGFGYPAAFAEGRTPRMRQVADRLMALDTTTRDRMLHLMYEALCPRHRDVDGMFLRRFDEVRGDLGDLDVPEQRDQLLLGAYFGQEYAFESAALFNPSIVTIPDQDPNDDSIRFILSLRGIGEGHISSVTFRTGTWDAGHGLVIEPPSPAGVPPRIESDNEGWVRMRSEESQNISETVIFPILPSQRQGVEDLRLTHFTDLDGVQSVIGTYTAFDGKDARAELLRGIDLRTYEMRALTGAMAAYKGMALFPRRVNGQFAMLGRQDSENLYILFSDDLFTWETGTRIMGPKYPWEFVQIGNCGSPIEIEEGWLVFTHGVGLVRGYCIGACLLDKEDPTKVLARTASPLLFPSAEQRGGYVPNVTYSCGALLHKRQLLVPYAIGDEFSAFAVGSVDDLLSAMEPA
jgi:predicted GH43/DUF377 family glycosyl hydrolase